jgi:hypothetical protein
VANLYGVANPVTLPAYATPIGGVDIVCPAGAETNVIALTFNSVTSSGWFAPWVYGQLAISLAATPATSVTVGARLGAGSDWAALGVNTYLLTANANIAYFLYAIGGALIMHDPAPGLVHYITINPGAQPVTLRNSGTQTFGAWLRAPDQ